MYVAVNAAPKGKVCGQRRNVCINRVINPDGQNIVRADIEVRRHIKNEIGISAIMFPEKGAVEIDVRDQERAVKFQKEMAVRVTAARGEMDPIPTGALVEI